MASYRPLTDIPISLLSNSSRAATGYVIEARRSDNDALTDLYQDANGTSAGSSITLDSRGEPTTIKRIWLDTSVTYKLIYKTDTGATVWTADPVYGSPRGLVSEMTGDASNLTVIPSGGSYARALEDLAADVVSPKSWYGLVVGGDWASAINAAIAACPDHGTVRLDGSMTIGSTITIGRDNITIMGPAKLTAKASTNFEYMVYGTGRTNCKVVDIYLDANKANRSSGQNVRFMGGAFLASTECGFERVTALGCRGFGGTSAVGLAVAGASTRCYIDNCTIRDCGDAGYESDAIFTSGTQNTTTNCRAYNCLDTAFVIENSDYSIISGCSSYDCASAAAITLSGNDDRRGNCISGLTVRNWDAPSTGGVQIGCLSGTGNLYETSLTGVTMYADLGANYGSGGAVWVRKVGTGKARGVDITGITINGASYGVRVDDGENVTVNGGTIKGVTVASAYFAAGVDHAVKGCHLQNGDYGVSAAGSAEVDVFANTFKSQVVACIAALNTSNINNQLNVYKSISGTRTAKDAGATINSFGMISSQPVLSNILTSAAAGTLAKKVEVYDRDGASQGFMYLYTT